QSEGRAGRVHRSGPRRAGKYRSGFCISDSRDDEHDARSVDKAWLLRHRSGCGDGADYRAVVGRMSIGTTTVEEFHAAVGGSEPVPAGVSISAVSAGLALSLLAKVLRITAGRKDFEGDRARIEQVIQDSREESAALMALADDDVRAFN